MHPLRKIDKETVLWRVYWHGRGEDAFNRLVSFYLPWVKQLAFKKASKLPDSVDWHDLYQDGSMALLDCIQRYDKGRGVKFYAFSSRRINGAFADGLRNMDWVPRLARTRKEPTVLMQQVKPLYNDNNDEKPELSHPATCDRNAAEWRDEVRRALRGLRKDERLAMILYFLDGRTMNEVGESLGLSESRVSQIISRTIAFLRNREKQESA